jgi:hypothetical protein
MVNQEREEGHTCKALTTGKAGLLRQQAKESEVTVLHGMLKNTRSRQTSRDVKQTRGQELLYLEKASKSTGDLEKSTHSRQQQG